MSALQVVAIVIGGLVFGYGVLRFVWFVQFRRETRRLEEERVRNPSRSRPYYDAHSFHEDCGDR